MVNLWDKLIFILERMMALVESCEHEKVRNFRKKDQWLWMN